MSKSKKATLPSRKINDKYVALVASAASIGFNAAGSFREAVRLATAAKTSKLALERVGEEYVIGYVARSLQRDGDNRTESVMFADAGEVIAKAAPSSAKPDRRTDEQHKAVRAAQTSWSKVKRAAGIAATKAGGRKPRPASNAKEPPRDMVFASPKLANDNDARDYFRNAFAALLATAAVNKQTGAKKEVKHISFLVEAIIADAKALIEKALA